MQSSLSDCLIRLIRSRPIDDGDRRVAASLLLDAAANIVAGSHSLQARRFLAWAVPRHAPEQPLNAAKIRRPAFLIGALCHIHEVDDLHRTSVVHPGCVVAPVLWALAEGAEPGRRDGRRVLDAFIRGVEAVARIGMAVGPAHYAIWHNTATCGPFGAAMAAGEILQLDAEQARNALGNAGTQSAGLWEFLDSGAMSKHLHAGHADEAGLTAAELAGCGVTGPPRIFEGPRGFFAAMCPDGEAGQIIAEPDAPWQIHQTSIKPWPSCRHTHPAIDAALEAGRRLREAGLAADGATSIRLSTYDAALALCDRAEPGDTYGAKFSLQHTVAVALAGRALDFEAFGAASRRDMAGLRAKVRVRATPEFEGPYPNHWGAELRLEHPGMATTLVIRRDDALGDPEAPLSAQQLIDKAYWLLGHGRHRDPAGLIAAILAMPDGGPMPDLELSPPGADAN